MLARRSHPRALIDFGTGTDPVLWMCRPDYDSPGTFLERVRLPGLVPERVATLNAKLSAIAVSSDGQRIVAIKISPVEGRTPDFMLWDGKNWSQVPSEVKPDISSRLAWIDDHSIAFESQARNLSILNLNTGVSEQGPTGCCPTRATDLRRWYGLCGGRALAFNADEKKRWESTGVEEFRIKNATSLSVTADGEVFTWTEPRFWFGSRTFIQKRGQVRICHHKLKEGTWAVLGPFKM